MPEESVLQLGAVAVLFLVGIREFFSYLKSKKEGNGNGMSQAILSELRTMNTNHLHSIEAAVNDSSERLITAMHRDNAQMIALLGEIKGNLNK